MITKDFHEKIVTDHKEFNKFLEEYTEIIIQKVLLDVPKMVLHHLKELQDLEKHRKEFYSNFAELKDHTKLVAQTINTVAARNPDKSKEDIFNLAGEQAMKILKEEESNAQGI